MPYLTVLFTNNSRGFIKKYHRGTYNILKDFHILSSSFMETSFSKQYGKSLTKANSTSGSPPMPWIPLQPQTPLCSNSSKHARGEFTLCYSSIMCSTGPNPS